jgi:nitroreductase
MTREFTTEPIDPALIDELLDTARRAPSAGFSQGIHFVVLSGERCDLFWRLTGGDEYYAERRPALMNAPIIVLPFAAACEYTARYSEPDKIAFGLDKAETWPVPFWITDVSMACMNLLLLVEERGLGALYFGISAGAADLFAELGVPDSALCTGVIAIGHREPAEEPSGSSRSRPRRPLPDMVHHQHW